MKILRNLLSSDYGMLGVLILLCVFSVITFEEQNPVGEDGADRLLAQIVDQFENPGSVIIAGRGSDEGRNFVSHLKNELSENGWLVEAAISGSPVDLGMALRDAVEKKEKVILLACEQTFSVCQWLRI